MLVVSVTIVFVQILLYVIPFSLRWVMYELSMLQNIVQIQSVMWMTLFSIGFFIFIFIHWTASSVDEGFNSLCSLLRLQDTGETI